MFLSSLNDLKLEKEELSQKYFLCGLEVLLLSLSAR